MSLHRSKSRFLAMQIAAVSFALMAIFVFQLIAQNCNSENLRSAIDSDAQVTAINKSEFEWSYAGAPSALNVARFCVLSDRVLDNETKSTLLSTLGVTRLNKATNSILSRVSADHGFILKDAIWSGQKSSSARAAGVRQFGMTNDWSRQLNDWFKVSTCRLLDIDEFHEEPFDAKTRQIFATSVYANLEWKQPFLVSSTQSENFFTHQVWSEFYPPSKEQTMHCHGQFDFYSDEDLKAIKMPCKQMNSKPGLDVILVVPTSGPGGLPALKDRFREWDSSKWTKFVHRFRATSLDLAVPKIHCSELADRDLEKYTEWKNKFQQIWPQLWSYNLRDITVHRSFILDEKGFRFAEGDIYYLDSTHSWGSSFKSGSGEPLLKNQPNTVYFHYHPKDGMVIDQDFMILLFDKKTNALLYIF